MSNLANIDFFKQEAETRMAAFMPDRPTILKEISFALQHIAKNAQLEKCSPESKLKAVVNISQIGLTLNPVAKEAYLVPRWNNLTKASECALEPSYVGLTKLLTDAGSVKSVVTQAVFEKDTFSINLADNQNPVTHNPCLTGARGEMIGVYTVATLHDNTRQAEWMNMAELHAIRGRSETYKAFKEGKIKTCVWVTDEVEMCRKTIVRRIYKYLPRTDRMNEIDEAINLDNSDYAISDDQRLYIIELAERAHYDDNQMKFLRVELQTMNPATARELIDTLKEKVESHESDPNMTLNVRSKDLNKHIKEIATSDKLGWYCKDEFVDGRCNQQCDECKKAKQ